MIDLKINGIDASAHGVHMGDGYLSSLLAFPPMKSNVETKSRMLDGKKVIFNKRYDTRELTLSFVVIGEGMTLPERRKSRMDRLDWLRSELEKGKVTIQVEAETQDVFRLLYTGKSVTFGFNQHKTVCKVSAKFEEPNPANRGTDDDMSIIATNTWR